MLVDNEVKVSHISTDFLSPCSIKYWETFVDLFLSLLVSLLLYASSVLKFYYSVQKHLKLLYLRGKLTPLLL